MTQIAQAGAFVPTEAQLQEMARRLRRAGWASARSESNMPPWEEAGAGVRERWLAEARAAFRYASQVIDSFALEQARLCREECDRLRAAAAPASAEPSEDEMIPQELPECWRHPDRLCPGECQYVLAHGECMHERVEIESKL